MLNFKSVDKPVLDCDVSGVGLYEHGEKLRELFKEIGSDFNEINDWDIPQPPEGTIDADGNYLEYKTDVWGVKSVYSIFGIAGHPVERPLDDWTNLKRDFPMPELNRVKDNPATREDYENWRKFYAEKSKTYYCRTGFMGLLEVMKHLRKYEDVLMDLYDDSPEINYLADVFVGHNRNQITNLLDFGVDAVQFGEDYGTQTDLIVSPDIFRSFFKPRLKELIAPVKAAGKSVFFHSCGYILPILEDLKEIGVDAIWPQVNLFDMKEFAAHCRSIELATAIHPERSHLLTNGTPEQIRRKMHEYNDIFRPQDGGSWFYLEIDNGFPWENIVAMVDVIKELRG